MGSVAAHQAMAKQNHSQPDEEHLAQSLQQLRTALLELPL